MDTSEESWRLFSPEELEKQYQPSMWVRRVPTSDAVPDFVRTICVQAERARREVPGGTEVRYGTGPEQRYRVLGTDLPKNAPLAVYIHGGYWQELSLELGSEGPALGFHSNGWRTVAMGYDLAPGVNMDQIVQQVRVAGRRILRLAKELGSRSVLIFGHSAGAHLTAMLLADWSTLPEDELPLVGAAVYVSGVFDLSPLVKTTVNDALKMNDEIAKRNSPMGFVSNLAKLSQWKHIVLVGEYDSPEFQRQSRIFCESLSKSGCESSCYTVEKRDHFNIIMALGEPGSDVLSIVGQELEGSGLG